jgi:hypothetical protein
VDARGEVVVYECSGIRIASEFQLSAPQSTDQNPMSADARFLKGQAREIPFKRPSAEVVAELIVDDYPWYTFCRVGEGYVGRMTGIADFNIDADLRTVVCDPALDGRSHVIPIVIPGTVTAFLLAIRGWSVLHGSAVEIDDRALAFVGVSGQGKSTMAALFCSAGAALVTDDVLPLAFDQGPNGDETVHCLRGGNEIRLREKSASLADRFNGGVVVRVTADERHGVIPFTTTHARLPLSAIVLPRPDREITAVHARRLGAGEASLWLGRCQRIEGWREPSHLRQQFVDVGRVVSSVPVFEVFVPWGPPFAEDLAEQVAEACQLTGISEGLAKAYPSPGS